MNVGDTVTILGNLAASGDAKATVRTIRYNFWWDIDYAPQLQTKPNDWNEKEQKYVIPTSVLIVVTVHKDGGRTADAQEMVGNRILKSGQPGDPLRVYLPYDRTEYPYWLNDLLSRFESGELS